MKFSTFAIVGLGLAASAVQGAPLSKRIAQSISASTVKWEALCRQVGGGEKCNPLSVTAFSTLLLGAGPCEQQDAADAMVDLAKELKSQELIGLSQIFRQQARNSPNSVSIPYCQKAPKNAELNGLFQCQFAGADRKTFVGGVAVGGAGTIPFGLNAPVNPPGSCPAHPDAAVPDGQQLVDLVSSPGVPAPGTDKPTTPTPTEDSKPEAPSETEEPTCEDEIEEEEPQPTVPDETEVEEPQQGEEEQDDTVPAPTTPAPTTPAPGAGGFQLDNAKAAQKLNAVFATLTPDSPCTEDGCVNGAFAKCDQGKFVLMPCAGGLICAAAPLVNKAGTSTVCTTAADALDRIVRTGATGGLTG